MKSRWQQNGAEPEFSLSLSKDTGLYVAVEDNSVALQYNARLQTPDARRETIVYNRATDTLDERVEPNQGRADNLLEHQTAFTEDSSLPGRVRERAVAAFEKYRLERMTTSD